MTDSITAINTNTKSVMETDSVNASQKILNMVCMIDCGRMRYVPTYSQNC